MRLWAIMAALMLPQQLTVSGSVTEADPVYAHPRTYLVTCAAPPKLASTAKVEVVRVARTSGRVRVLLRSGRRMAVLSARRVADGVWRVHGPPASRAMLAAAGCYVVEYDAPTIAVRLAVRAQATCCGRARIRGRVYAAWPCRWESTRTSTVLARTGLGPGVVAGEPACTVLPQE